MTNSRLTIGVLLLLAALLLASCKGKGEDGSKDNGLKITTAALPNAVVNSTYTEMVAASGGTNTGFSWGVVSGALPPGLNIAASGTPQSTLSGMPNTLGSYSFTLQVVDSDGAVATRAYVLDVVQALSVTTTSLPPFTQGAAFSATLSASGGSGAGRTWTISAGTLPVGLTLSAAGIISGTPSALGAASFTVQVQDSASNIANLAFSVTVRPPLSFVTPSILPATTTGRYYQQALTATGGSASGYGWSISSGQLPSGFELPAFGTPSVTLRGVAAVSGTYNISIQLTDSEGRSTNGVFTLQVYAALRISAHWLPEATQGLAYSAQLEATGGTGTGQSWNVVRGSLPSGLVLSGAALAGTPTVAGAYSFRLRVTDSGSFLDELEYRMDVNPTGTALEISEQFLASAVTGRAYRSNLSARGGTGGYAWSVSSGALPAGLTLQATGTPWTRVSGTATASAVANFVVTVTDSASNTATHNYTLIVSDSGTIDLAAGSGAGSSGGVGDGGPATNAVLSQPRGIAVDSAGRLYIADEQHNRVRRVDAAGNITTFAGTGNDGYSGDGGAATSAELWIPEDVCLHEASNSLYIADYGNGVVRRVDLVTGIISTYAGGGSSGLGDGGLATLAQMEYPEGLGVDGAGNLYIACLMNLYGNRVRRVDFATKIITTTAGDGTEGSIGDGGPGTSAKLFHPHDVACDAAGNVYIADFSNNRIRRVNASTGIISAFAGTGVYGFSGDGGPAAAAQMRAPNSLFFDPAGNLYVSDELNHRIRRINTSGNINTVAGSGAAGGAGGYTGDGGVATSATLNRQNGVAVDTAGNLYIADRDNEVIRRVAVGTQIITTYAGGGSGLVGGSPPTSLLLGSATDVAVDGAGNVYLADISDHKVYVIRASDGQAALFAGTGLQGSSGDGGPALAADLNEPCSLAVDFAGNLYIGEGAGARVRKVDVVTGLISTFAGTGTSGLSGDGGQATSAMITFPVGLALHPDGRLLIADESNFRVRAVNLVSGVITTIAGTNFGFSGDGGAATSAQFGLVRDVCVDGSWNILIGDGGNRRLRRVNYLSGIISTVAGDGTTATLDPEALTVLPDGSIVVANSTNHRVSLVAPDTGAISPFAGNGTSGFAGDGGAATVAELYYPGDVQLDANGDVLICTAERVRRVFRP